MTRTHLLSTTVLGLALLAAPALAQRQGPGGDTPSSAAQNRTSADVDRLHKGNGTNGGPAELLRSAQEAMRRGQTAQANELLERAETRLLLRATGGDSARPGQGEPAHHVAEARRALVGRDRAEAMRHTNLAIATVRDDSAAAAGSDAGRQGAQGGGGGRSGAVDSGMGSLPGGRAVVRDGGTGGTSVSRAEGVVLAQSGTTGGNRGGGTALPPGDSIPGWSGARGGAPSGAWGGSTPTPQGTPQGTTTPGGLAADPSLGGNTRGGALTSGSPNATSGPSSSSMTGGEPARVGGAPPGDTSRSPGSSGISGSGIGNSGVGGPVR
jgi:hypothetical protein